MNLLFFLLAILPAQRCTDHVAYVEINTFGKGVQRTAVLYRDEMGHIVDWRWFVTARQIPRPLGNGRYIAVWDDQGIPRTVTCDYVRYTQSLVDKELTERAVLPVERRRKLSIP